MAHGLRAALRKTVICLCLLGLTVPGEAAGQVSGDAAASTGIVEDSVRFRSGSIELRGLLRLPAGPGPFPAVVLLPGGGRQFLTLEPDYFAGRLATAGIAALVYDKRGTGASSGEWGSATFEDFIADAGAAIDHLRAHPLVNGRIGVMGFSQGGRLAPVVAARFGGRAVVSISGPQIPVPDTRLFALRNAFREAGLSDEHGERSLLLWREFMDRLLDGADSGDLDERILEAGNDIPAGTLPPLRDAHVPSPIFNSLAFDAAADLERLDVPYLAMFGEYDLVVPVAASVEALRAVVPASDYREVEIIVLPGLGHGLSVDPYTRHALYESKPVEWLGQQLR